MTREFGVVILAAGASTRLGQPKQLLAYAGKTLVEHAAQTALDSGAHEVVVVVGADALAIEEKLATLSVRVVINSDWEEGMGSSIRLGVSSLATVIECVVIALCDQPRMTSDLVRALAERHFETGAPIVACTYNSVIGAPSAFGVELFPSLMSLQGDTGARELIRKSQIPIQTVAFGGGSLDVDTEADYRRLVDEFSGGDQ